RSAPGGASRGGGGTTASKYKFVTGSPSEWSDRELNILNEGLTRYAREPNIMRYIKIAAMLPNRTIRDVALRCWWAAGKDRRKKPEGFFTGKKMRDMKDKMFASAPMANFHMAPTNNLTPFSISMENPNQQCQVPKEVQPSSSWRKTINCLTRLLQILKHSRRGRTWISFFGQIATSKQF
uniref:Myb-like domain-containing protein n=1 Tax=Aegilops tauschii subsp. strangulata TaxID=200361 RepID=A0A453DE82_AEGTS